MAPNTSPHKRRRLNVAPPMQSESRVANESSSQPRESLQAQLPQPQGSSQNHHELVFSILPGSGSGSGSSLAATTAQLQPPPPRPPPSQPQSVPIGWGPMAHPKNMTMSLHEALGLLDPTDQMPHDLYVILAWAAAAHPDVGEMLDKFARGVQERLALAAEEEAAMRAVVDAPSEAAPSQQPEKQQEQPQAVVTYQRFEPMDLLDEDPSISPNGARTTTTTSAIEATTGTPTPQRKRKNSKPPPEETREDKEKREQSTALRRARREAKALVAREKKAQKVASAVTKPGDDKDFGYLVHRAAVEMGWTGQYAAELDPHRAPRYSRIALRKEASFWHNKGVNVRDNLKWMQKQLVNEIRAEKVPFGTRRNALTAMRDITRIVVVDTTGLGEDLRQHWWDALLQNFKKVMAFISYGELDRLRKENNGQWIRDLKSLIREVRERELSDTLLMEILRTVDSRARDDLESIADASEREEEKEEARPAIPAAPKRVTRSRKRRVATPADDAEEAEKTSDEESSEEDNASDSSEDTSSSSSSSSDEESMES